MNTINNNDETIVRSKSQYEVWIEISGKKCKIEDGHSISVGRRSNSSRIKNDQDIQIDDSDKHISRGKSVIFKRIGSKVEIKITGQTVVIIDNEEYFNCILECLPEQSMMIGNIPCYIKMREIKPEDPDATVFLKRKKKVNKDPDVTIIRKKNNETSTIKRKNLESTNDADDEVEKNYKSEINSKEIQENIHDEDIQDEYDESDYNPPQPKISNNKNNKKKYLIHNYGPVQDDNSMEDKGHDKSVNSIRWSPYMISLIFILFIICFIIFVWPGFLTIKNTFFKANNTTSPKRIIVEKERPLIRENTIEPGFYYKKIQDAKELIANGQLELAEELLLQIPDSSNAYQDAERLINEIDQKLYR